MRGRLRWCRLACHQLCRLRVGSCSLVGVPSTDFVCNAPPGTPAYDTVESSLCKDRSTRWHSKVPCRCGLQHMSEGCSTRRVSISTMKLQCQSGRDVRSTTDFFTMRLRLLLVFFLPKALLPTRIPGFTFLRTFGSTRIWPWERGRSGFPDDDKQPTDSAVVCLGSREHLATRAGTGSLPRWLMPGSRVELIAIGNEGANS
ncbi:hypothetical protein V8C26DRAFT_63399 [Trichoderma gracile]